jgi:hypothetical protein
MRPAVRVASIPSGHPYVAHLDLAAGGVMLLPDPLPSGAPAGRWWPPVMLDRSWIEGHADDFDLMHLHFGSESLSVAQLESALDALGRAGRPLVYTVHDLVHPQLTDQDHHRAQLDLLITRANELVTLTAGAAREIAERWGRRATVIPHPRMLPAHARRTLVAPHEAIVAGVHLRDLRPNINGPAVTRALVDATAWMRERSVPTEARVAMFDHVRYPAARDAVRAACAAAPHVCLVEQRRPDDAALIAALGALDVSVLPYTHGTHSGWAELCWDLAVPVVGAPVGYIAEQHADPGWFTACDPTNPVSLAAAIEHVAAASRGGTRGASAHQQHQRRHERDLGQPAIVAAHRQVYARALGQPLADTSITER